MHSVEVNPDAPMTATVAMQREDSLRTPGTALDPGVKLDWNAFTVLAHKRMAEMADSFILQVVDVESTVSCGMKGVLFAPSSAPQAITRKIFQDPDLVCGMTSQNIVGRRTSLPRIEIVRPHGRSTTRGVRNINDV